MPYVSNDQHEAAQRAGSATDATTLSFDSTIDEVWADPDGLLRQLRRQDPVHWSDLEQAWVLTRHADALSVLRDDRTFSADARIAGGDAGTAVRGVAGTSPLPYSSMLSSAGHADHARLRRSAAAAFAPASVAALRAPIDTLARDLLHAAAARGEELDAIGQFAQPLSLGITLQLLGIEAPAVGRLTLLADLLMRASQFGPGAVRPGHPPDEAARELAEARLEIGAVIDELAVRDGTLLASLRTARDAGRLSDDDLVALVVFIATVGQAPTAFVLGSALLALLRNPDQIAELRADLQGKRVLLGNLVDEAARFDPPVRVIRRFATTETALGDRRLNAGDQIAIVVPATNRDPALFHDPNRFDLHRGARNHLGFGWGSHHCLGAPVSRAIAEGGFAALLAAYPDITASGRLELMTGEIAGPVALTVIGRPGTHPATLEAARAGDVAARSVPRVPGNHACPCGSGRKAKRCHASK